jgi:uncharacterized protein (TIGR03437 family)
MTIYGVGLGPPTGISGVPDENGIFPTQLGGVSIEFESPGQVKSSAPLLYVGPGQINFEVPLNQIGSAMTITTPTGSLPPIYTAGYGSIGIFAALNPDGSVNSAANPAPDGSIVALFLTGISPCVIPLPCNPGAISRQTGSIFSGKLEVLCQDISLYLPYAGNAPGEINGLEQINVQLPEGIGDSTLTIMVPEGGVLNPETSVPFPVYIH